MVYPFMIAFIRFGVGLLEEKELRILEGMKVMGLKHRSSMISWLIWIYFINFLVSILAALIVSSFIMPN